MDAMKDVVFWTTILIYQACQRGGFNNTTRKMSKKKKSTLLRHRYRLQSWMKTGNRCRRFLESLWRSFVVKNKFNRGMGWQQLSNSVLASETTLTGMLGGKKSNIIHLQVMISRSASTNSSCEQQCEIPDQSKFQKGGKLSNLDQVRLKPYPAATFWPGSRAYNCTSVCCSSIYKVSSGGQIQLCNLPVNA
jgi:hypothetical protein